MLPTPPPYNAHTQTHVQAQLAQQQTIPQPAVTTPSSLDSPAAPGTSSKKRRYTRIAAVTIVLVLAIALYFVWHASPSTLPSSGITQQNFGNGASSTANSSAAADGDIQAYIVGAVKHPGVYTLPAGARVYQLLQAAGGPLPNANLVALNLAAKLSDGQEVYVTVIGETPPTYVGGVPAPGASASGTPTSGLVNINTASADEMRQSLHISSATAQAIVDYRTQHGPYTSVDQLLQVVSRSIYDKIKGLVTV